MTIRNSEIENLLSTDEAATKYGLTKSPIPDSDVRILTSKSIAYFHSIDFDELSENINDFFVDDNIYDVLFVKYPLATKALVELGNWSNKGIKFNKLIVPENNLDEFIDFNYFHDKFANENGIIVDSGMNPVFSKELLNQLEKITAEELPIFYSDSFKSLTRHTEKLLKVIEYVLRHNGVFVTANFYITNGYVSKRKDLLKPMHTNEDFISNLKNLHGLNKPHFNLLKSIRNQLD